MINSGNVWALHASATNRDPGRDICSHIKTNKQMSTTAMQLSEEQTIKYSFIQQIRQDYELHPVDCIAWMKC